MAVIRAWESFDQNNLNLNRFYENAYDWGLSNNVYWQPFGEDKSTYKDVYWVDWSLDSDTYQSDFGGQKITIDNNGYVTGGEANLYLESHLDTDANWLYFIWAIDEVSIPVTEMIDAASTSSTKDDYKIINKALAGNDKFFLSDEDDFAKGLGGKDKMYGNGGEDTLSGGNDNDKLFGGADADNLKGGKGNDKLYGEAGNDVLKGQGGADSFVFRAGYEQDLIKDFSDKDDVLDLRSFGFGSVKEAKSYASMFDGDTVFDFGDGDVLILEDFNMSALDKGDFII